MPWVLPGGVETSVGYPVVAFGKVARALTCKRVDKQVAQERDVEKDLGNEWGKDLCQVIRPASAGGWL
jgi:hypothetical protein